ncbi:MAG: hypothetical protein KDD94_02480, partial [Calditrichaeota bacterium]|nr:hypothetical protein [Calditrichota bacterium]
ADVTELNQYVEQFGQLQRSYKNRLEDLFKQANQKDKDDLRKELNQLISANAYIERIFTNIEAKLEIYENE